MTGNPEAAPPPAQCPVCRVSMEPERHGTLTLDRCPRCSGLWFDRHELDAYYRSLPSVSATIRAPERVPDAVPLPCARCRTETLRSYRIGAVLISRCTTCAGMYLDSNDVRALSGTRVAYGIPGQTSPSAGGIVVGVTGEMIIDIVMTAGFRAAVGSLKGL
jgi:Zn-finger nucleic acid-binding protein